MDRPNADSPAEVTFTGSVTRWVHSLRLGRFEDLPLDLAHTV